MHLNSLSEEDLEVIANEISHLDPDGDYVQVDFSTLQVAYSKEIQQDERIDTIRGPEEIVRAYVVAWLGKVGAYPASALHLEKKYPYGSGGKNAQLDIRIAHAESTTAYALVELKQPEQWAGKDDPAIKNQLYSFAGTEPALEVLSFATVTLDARSTPQIEAVTIDFVSYPHEELWAASDRPFRADIPIAYSRAIVEPLTRHGDRDLSHAVNRVTLNQRRKSLHTRLWGGSNDDNQIYGWLVKFFLAKIHDERTTKSGQPYALQVLHNGATKESPETTASRLQEVWVTAYRRYLDNQSEPPNLTGSFLSDGEIAWVVEAMQDISLTSAGRSTGDLLGAFFEAITRDGFKQSKGLFFTHYNIAAFMVEALDLRELAERYVIDDSRHTNERLPVIMDPSCGSGTFILAAMRAISQHLTENRERLSINEDVDKELRRWLPEGNSNQWAAQFLYGIEKREDLTVSTKVNMVLHQDGATHIYHNDALAPLSDIADRHAEEKLRPSQRKRSGYVYPVAESVDAIVTNPPFSITLDGDIARNIENTFELSSESNSENIFIERWYQLLKPGGRLAAVLPESTFSTAENARVRRFIFSHFQVKAVVALPGSTFQPWTPTRTSILFAEKRPIAQVDAWSAALTEERQRLATEISKAKSSLRRLTIPRKKDTSASLQSVAFTAKMAMKKLGLAPQALADDSSIAAATATVKAFDVEAAAFAHAVSKLASTENYLAASVDEVGFRRTKRAENARPNDLFTAVRADGSKVRNLNDDTVGWAIELGGDDVLSKIKAARIWD